SPKPTTRCASWVLVMPIPYTICYFVCRQGLFSVCLLPVLETPGFEEFDGGVLATLVKPGLFFGGDVEVGGLDFESLDKHGAGFGGGIVDVHLVVGVDHCGQQRLGEIV